MLWRRIASLNVETKIGQFVVILVMSTWCLALPFPSFDVSTMLEISCLISLRQDGVENT